MNERIRELAEQAHVTVLTTKGMEDIVDGCYIVSPDKLAKFAELIVRECAKFLEDNSGYDDSNNAWHPEPEDLLKHFGVEE